MRIILPLAALAVLLAGCAQPIIPPDQIGSSSSSISSTSSKSSTSSSPVSLSPSITLSDPRVEIFAKDLSGARVMVRDSFGNMWVSRPKAGVVTLLEMSGSVVTNQYDVFRDLRNPHGLAMNNEGTILYIAEETSIKKAILYSDAPVETIATLPAGGRHFTRTIGFGPDNRLYVSIGSTCDSCVEANELHGTIISMNEDGSDRRIFARGLRNAIFFDWSYVDGQMYATEMGRDTLGDVTPPDEIDRITEGANYGWPYCYGDRIRDERISKDYDCSATEPPHIALPAHVAPLGLAFIPEEGWPEEWWYDLLVAEHGSWNSSVKVGYKIVRIPLDAQGNQEGEPVDFLTGFLDGNTVKGRPVDLMIEPGGTLYVSDDGAGVVYKVNVNR
jgi:glucose/arabinose dehydrogenase